jgi:ribosome-associated toxin RatA of RatAB toxin-antitoxin module
MIPFARRVLRVLAAGCLCATLAFVPGAAIADGPPAAPAKGEVQVNVYTVAGSKTPKVVVRAIVEQPPRKVWAVVSDCAHYSSRLPRVAKSRLVSKVGNKHTCEVTISLPFPLANLTAVTEATHEESESGMSRRWKLVSGDYTVNNGSWEVRPLDAAGTSSLVTYTVQAEPTTSVPDFVRMSAQKKALPELIERVRLESAKMP